MPIDFSMSEAYLFGATSGVRQSEIDIRHIFTHHLSTLCNQKWKIVDQITDWSNTLIRQIQEYVAEQRKLLEQVYEEKVRFLDSIRDQLLNRVLIYEQNNDTQQIHQLIDQCNTLKFELAILVPMERPIQSIQIIREEQIMQQNRVECNEQKTEGQQFQKNSNNNTINNADANETSTPKLTSANTELTNQPSSITKSTNNDDQSIINNHKLENNNTQHNGLIEKCPICFMIFPQSMTTHARNLHINEHYRDD